jgi:hypothetical protein
LLSLAQIVLFFNSVEEKDTAACPAEFPSAEKELKKCIGTLNTLRPDWAVEENIERRRKWSGVKNGE